MIYEKYIRSLPLISLETRTAFEPAATRAYRALEHMIVTLELPPASFVTEGALIDRLGLGRTPVREAIQRLAWEGLLDVRPRAGVAVAPLHPGDWLRVLDARRG
ncbi:MAG: GntR family transcriptional regulator, partial [Mesorhizobium sp.]